MADNFASGAAERWARILDEARLSPLTIAEFCKSRQISQTSFYKWRRKLHQRPNPDSNPLGNVTPVFQPIQIIPTAHQPTTHQQPGIQATVSLATDVLVEIRVNRPDDMAHIIATLMDRLSVPAAARHGADA